MSLMPVTLPPSLSRTSIGNSQPLRRDQTGQTDLSASMVSRGRRSHSHRGSQPSTQAHLYSSGVPRPEQGTGRGGLPRSVPTPISVCKCLFIRPQLYESSHLGLRFPCVTKPNR